MSNVKPQLSGFPFPRFVISKAGSKIRVHFTGTKERVYNFCCESKFAGRNSIKPAALMTPKS